MTLTRPVAAVLFLAAAASLSDPAPATAQPDKVAAMEKAKAKFEVENAKAEEALIASFDRATAKAKSAGNKQLVEKLAYEKDLFVRKRITPTAISAVAYLKQRTQAQNALEAVFQPVIKDHLKNKKDEEAEALEDELSALVKATRGYGTALPDLEGRTQVLLENKGSGQVLELVKDGGYEKVQLAAKVGKKKPAQCWAIEREEKGVIFRNAANGHVMHATGYGRDLHALGGYKLDPTKETPDTALFTFAEGRREVTFTSQSKYNNGQLFTVTEKKLKGVTSYELALERKDQALNQTWVVTEAK